ncbi:MAG: response regulator [Thermoplasmatales archaeon]|nr:MAG: response regulator [Thermoplasmatales archaeon]
MKKIMVVDDEQDFLFTIKDVFKSFCDEYELITAKSGIQYLKLLEDNQIPDLFLLDIMMPDVNGWEVARKLRQNLKWKNIPIIFISAIGDRTSKITPIELAEEFIEKPFNMKDLKIKIDEILKK